MCKSTKNTITVNECRYCDHTMYHRPYGMDDVAVCMGCGAEWDPVPVQYTHEELNEEYTCIKCNFYRVHGPHQMCIDCECGLDEK